MFLKLNVKATFDKLLNEVLNSNFERSGETTFYIVSKLSSKFEQ
jgi:hypothetical protein